jgi:hypothetical protein
LIIFGNLFLFVFDLLAILHIEHAWWSTIVSIFAVGDVANGHPHADKHQRQQKVLEQDYVQREFDQDQLETYCESKYNIGNVFDYHQVANYYDVSAILSAVCVFKS